MINECNSDLGHDEAADLMQLYLSRRSITAHREFRLPDSRIADLFIAYSNGEFEIIEVKKEYKANLLHAAADKYQRWCNFLTVAVPTLSAQELDRLKAEANVHSSHGPVGLTHVTRTGYTVLRAPSHRYVAPSLQALLRERLQSP